MMNDELEPLEPHPATHSAVTYVMKRIQDPILIESLASCTIENNRIAEICLGTINRIKESKQVSDRYLLGLAWFLKEMDWFESRRTDHT